MKSKTTRQIAIIGLFTAMAVALHIAEALLPNPVAVPGVKLGLANLITLIMLFMYPFSWTLEVVLLRVVIGGLLTGLFFSWAFLLSLAGALTALVVMAALRKLPRPPSVIGVSVAGAAAHNIGQLAVASLMVQQQVLLFYLPILLVSAIPTGLLIGVAAKFLLDRISPLGLQ